MKPHQAAVETILAVATTCIDGTPDGYDSDHPVVLAAVDGIDPAVVARAAGGLVAHLLRCWAHTVALTASSADDDFERQFAAQLLTTYATGLAGALLGDGDGRDGSTGQTWT